MIWVDGNRILKYKGGLCNIKFNFKGVSMGFQNRGEVYIIKTKQESGQSILL